MKINPKYGDRIIALPAAGVLGRLPDATGAELAVLIFALANQECSLEEMKNGTGLGAGEIEDALSVWKKAGVITYSGLRAKKAHAASSAAAGEKTGRCEKREDGSKTVKTVILTSELPSYTTSQITEILQKNKETKNLIDACQQTLGRIFKIHEVEAVLKLSDYLNLGADYILLLLAHCASVGKTSLRYIETTAVNLFDSGITEYTQLERYFEYEDTARGMEGRLRRLFGIGERALTKKERETFITWVSRGFSFDMIEKAYEVTVNNIGKASVPYASRTLENWYNAGYKTVKEVERAMERAKTDRQNESKGSFDTDDFFEAALKRSYKN